MKSDVVTGGGYSADLEDAGDFEIGVDNGVGPVNGRQGWEVRFHSNGVNEARVHVTAYCADVSPAGVRGGRARV